MNHQGVRVLVLLLGVVACRPEQRAASRAVALSAQSTVPDSAHRGGSLPRLWVYYGGEANAFCLSLHEDSTAQFYGGFLEHNPVRWRFASATGQLDLTLAHLTPDDLLVLRDNLARGYMSGLDSATGTLSYSIDPVKPTLSLFNWELRPAASLEDWQKPYAARGCPLIQPAGGA